MLLHDVMPMRNIHCDCIFLQTNTVFIIIQLSREFFFQIKFNFKFTLHLDWQNKENKSLKSNWIRVKNFRDTLLQSYTYKEMKEFIYLKCAEKKNKLKFEWAHFTLAKKRSKSHLYKNPYACFVPYRVVMPHASTNNLIKFSKKKKKNRWEKLFRIKNDKNDECSSDIHVTLSQF